MLFLIGIFTILIGFLLIITGIALSMFQDSESRQDHSKKTDAFGRETLFENTPDSDRSSHEKPPGKVESKIKAGGVIMLGPIPIIFGSDNESAKTVAILAIILMLLSLLIFKVSFF